MFIAASRHHTLTVASARRVAALAVALIGTAPIALGQVVTRVSVDSTGIEGNGASDLPAISSDGRFVAFVSLANNFGTGTLADLQLAFVHDRASGTTDCASVSSSGEVSNGYCYDVAISADGRFVAFSSIATNLVEGGGTGFVEVYLRDRLLGTTERVSIPSSGKPEDGPSLAPSISDDGRFVAFVSTASNLVENDTNRSPDIFVHDRGTNRTERVNVSSSGEQANDQSWDAVISADGSLVAFSSDSSNLVLNDWNTQADVFLRDRSAGTTERVSLTSHGGQGNGYSYGSSMSSDGRFVAFESYATNLVSNDTNSFGDIFVRDRVAATTERVSVDSSGGELNSESRFPSLSGDGSIVAFTTFATNIVVTDANGLPDVYLRDGNAGTTTLVSEDCAWVAGNGVSYYHVLSRDGTCDAFSSVASNLVDGDTNGLRDVFLYDRNAPPVYASRSYYGAGFPGTLGIPTLTASADPVFGTTFNLDTSNSSGSWSDALLLIGLQSASIPTSAGGTLLVDPAMELLFVLMPGGRTFPEHVARDPSLCGLTLYLQALELDPGAAKGISFTPGLQLTVGH